ncbi:hypothetical protein F975_02080 [Acinetobacter sp. ANC 3789]|uniref:hypothetical protein n=1 Tax=Acinetobacter sp. ANC 3789 TaxID=1217714 RepID=UPI0002CFD7C0|nr:hypothetical protein [Acinetobacter sp. ANC 3789]ENU80324.1 hypothetical protein F975_02080 [Acinetobacter sp. ANC 3789]
MAVKNLGKLTLDLVEGISQSEKSNQEQTVTEEMDSSNSTLKNRFMDVINKEQSHKSNFSQNATESMEAMTLAKKAVIPTHIQPSHFNYFDHNHYDQIEKQQKKISQAFQQEHERKEKLEQNRHDQLVSALERSNNQQALADENTQLKAEIEKLKQENSKLLKENKKIKNQGNIESTRAKNNLLDIIYVLVDMAELPIDNPFKAYGVMQLHADGKKLKIPSKDTVSKWLEDANNKNI